MSTVNGHSNHLQYSSAREGSRMTMLESIKLGLKLHNARMGPNPVPWKTLSKEFGLPPRTLQHHYRLHRERAYTLADRTGRRVARETLYLHEELLAEAVRAIHEADNSAAKIGAIRTAARISEMRLGLLNITNHLNEHEAERRLVGEILARYHDVLKAHNLDPQVWDDLVEVMGTAHGARARVMEILNEETV